MSKRTPVPTLKIITEPDKIRLHLGENPPRAVFIITLIAATIFIGLPLSDSSLWPSLWWLRWLVVLAIATTLGIWRKRVVDSGREDLFISHDGTQLTLPLLCDRKERVIIARDAIDRIAILVVPAKDSDESDQYFPTLRLKDGTDHQVAPLHWKEKAEAVTDWLRAQLKLDRH